MAGVDGACESVSVNSTDIDSRSQNIADTNPFLNAGEESKTSLAQTCFHDAVDNFISSIKGSSFKNHYREVYKKDKVLVRALYSQFVDDLKTKVSQEIDESILNDNFKTNLCRLDKIVADSRIKGSQKATKSKIWRPSRIPEKDLKPHRVVVKMETKTRLEEILANLKKDNAAIRQSNLNDEHTINQLEHQLNIKSTQLNEIAEVCEQIPYTNISSLLSSTGK